MTLALLAPEQTMVPIVNRVIGSFVMSLENRISKTPLSPPPPPPPPPREMENHRSEHDDIDQRNDSSLDTNENIFVKLEGGDENKQTIAHISLSEPPVAYNRLAGGTEFLFKNGSKLEMGDDGTTVITRLNDDPNGEPHVDVYGDGAKATIETITFPATTGEGGIKYSFFDAEVNRAIAQDPSARPEDLSRLIALGLHLDENGNPDTDVLVSLFENPVLNDELLDEVLLDVGVDGIYLQYLEHNAGNGFKPGDLWSGADDRPTIQGEAIVRDGGLAQHIANAASLSEIQSPFIEALVSAHNEGRLDEIFADVYVEAPPAQLNTLIDRVEESITSDNWSWLPLPELVSSDVLTVETRPGEGARMFAGAFAAQPADVSNSRIFINADLSADLQQQAYLEEVGHFFEARLHEGSNRDFDAEGDEGELFRLALSGALYDKNGRVNQSVLDRVQADISDDKGQITLPDGSELSVEFMDIPPVSDASVDSIPPPPTQHLTRQNNYVPLGAVAVPGQDSEWVSVDIDAPELDGVDNLPIAQPVIDGKVVIPTNVDVPTRDANGNIVSTKHYDGEGNYLGATTFEHDNKGNVILENRYDVDGHWTSSVAYNYVDGERLTVDLSPEQLSEIDARFPIDPGKTKTALALPVDAQQKKAIAEIAAEEGVYITLGTDPSDPNQPIFLVHQDPLVSEGSHSAIDPEIEARVRKQLMNNGQLGSKFDFDTEKVEAFQKNWFVESARNSALIAGPETHTYHEVISDGDAIFERATVYDKNLDRLSRVDSSITTDGKRIPVAEYQYDQLADRDTIPGKEFVLSETHYKNGLKSSHTARTPITKYDADRNPVERAYAETITEYDNKGVEAKITAIDANGFEEVKTFINIDGEAMLTNHYRGSDPIRRIIENVYEDGGLKQSTRFDTSLNSDNGPKTVAFYNTNDAGDLILISADEYEFSNGVRYLETKTEYFSGTQEPAEFIKYDAQGREIQRTTYELDEGRLRPMLSTQTSYAPDFEGSTSSSLYNEAGEPTKRIIGNAQGDVLAEITFEAGSNGHEGTIQIYNPPDQGYIEAPWSTNSMGAMRAPDGTGYHFPVNTYEGDPPRLVSTLKKQVVGGLRHLEKTEFTPEGGRIVGAWRDNNWSGAVLEYAQGDHGEELINTRYYGQYGEVRNTLTHTYEYETNPSGEYAGKKKITHDRLGAIVEIEHLDAEGAVGMRLEYGSQGEVVKAAIFDENMVERAAFHPAGNPKITGIDFGNPPSQVMSEADVADFHRLGNELRINHVKEFLEDSANDKYMSLLSTLDATAIAGLPYSALNRVSLEAPEDIIYDKLQFSKWLDSVSELPEDVISQDVVLKMQRYLNQLNNGYRNFGANKFQQWFFMEALEGRVNPGELSDRMIKFSSRMEGSNLLGKNPMELTQNIAKFVAGGFSVNRLAVLLGPVAAVGFIGIDINTGTNSLISVIEGEETAEALLYNIFLIADATNVPYAALGAALFAALDSHHKGGTARDISAAFFYGLVGFYDPSAPYGSFGEALFDYERNINRLRQIDIPPGVNHEGIAHGGYNWQASYDKYFQALQDAGVESPIFPLGMEPTAIAMDDPAHDGALQLAETEFYEFLRDNTPVSSEAHSPMIEDTNGRYVKRDADNNPTENPDEVLYSSWQWDEYETPQIQIRGTDPITSLEELNERLYFEGFVGPNEYDRYTHIEREGAMEKAWAAWESVQNTDWLEDDDKKDDGGYEYFPIGNG